MNDTQKNRRQQIEQDRYATAIELIRQGDIMNTKRSKGIYITQVEYERYNRLKRDYEQFTEWLSHNDMTFQSIERTPENLRGLGIRS